MRGIPVYFTDNHYKVVSGHELDQLLMDGKVKAFHRSTGWAIVGEDPVRGKGGMYTGPERRRRRGKLCSNGSKSKSQQLTEKKGSSCLTCFNLVEGKCLSKELLDSYMEVDSYASQ